MRDFRDAKAMAKTFRAALAAKGLKISVGESLELTAKALGAADWNTLSAAIRAARSETAAEPALAERPPDPSPPADRPRRGTYFSAALEATLHRAVGLAEARKHSYTTLEHLLLALTDDVDAAAVLEACRVDLARLRTDLTRYVEDELRLPAVNEDLPTAPTAGFHRVVQRAVIHVQSSGRGVVTGANILVAVFSEAESHACAFLTMQDATRSDAVNFIAHGIRKDDAPA
ncbi:MAG TPA: glyoxalase superfamily protein, partial [Caulobacteraceae bacterium]|jgi:hypothetical protein|nr:glyoxalase superfamily protein [Caulobacteraceae bacterium]